MTQNNPANLKVKSGDPVTARLWNRTIDRIAEGQNGYGGAIDLYGQTLVPYLVKQAGVEMGHLVHFEGYDGAQDDNNPHDLAAQMRFVGNSPLWYEKITRVGVAAEPAKKDEQVRAAISGLALVEIRGEQQPNKRFVQVDPEFPHLARPATGGFAKVLFEYGSKYCLVDLGERQNVWRYTLQQDVAAGASVGSISLSELDGTGYAGDVEMNFVPSVECKLDAGDSGLVMQCGNKWYAITACSSFLGCGVDKDLLIYQDGVSPDWVNCDLSGKHQVLRVFNCDNSPEQVWSILSPVVDKAVATSVSCAVNECGTCSWVYNDTPVPGWTKTSSCSFGCNCSEPLIADPQPLQTATTNCFGASGETAYLCFTLILENVTVWDCEAGGTSTDECCIPIFPPADCDDPCTT